MLLHNSEIELILGDFNINLLKDNTSSKELQHILKDFNQVIEFPTHADGGLIDHVYVKKSLLQEFSFDILKVCLSISDHDSLKIGLKVQENVDDDSY